MTIDFIGRSKEISTIKNAILSEHSRIICIVGIGGIGKTRLLHQMDLELRPHDNLYVCEVVDFDDPKNHAPDNIGQKIAEQLGNENFGHYISELQHKQFLEKHKASPEYISLQNLNVEKAFIEGYASSLKGRQIILRFDTTDNLNGVLAPFEYIAQLAKNLPSTYIIVAGRDSTRILEIMSLSEAQKQECVLHLLPLNKKECEEFLIKKIQQKRLSLDAILKERLLLLAQGKIILLDIAIEWLWKNNIPPKWINDINPNEQITDGDETLGEFESGLFDHIRNGKDPIDTLILLLSKVYPLDTCGIESLLDISSEEAKLLFDRAKYLTYVKEIPGSFIKLHDEAERIINKYLWDKIPPKRLRYTRERAINFLTARSNQLLSELTTINVENEYNSYIFLSQQLRHLLNLDLDKGYQLFLDNWEIAISKNSFTYQKMLLDEVLRHEEVLIKAQRWEFALYQAERLSKEEKNLDIVNNYFNWLVNTIPTRTGLYLRALLGRGWVNFRIGRLKNAINDLEEANLLSSTLDSKDLKIFAILSLAQLKTKAGNITLAIEDYLRVLREAIYNGDREVQASVLVELAYLKSLQGDKTSSTILVDQSIYIWRQLCDEKPIHTEGLGKAYYYAGKVFVELGLFQKAFNYLSLSWDLLLSLDLEEWRSTIRIERAVIYYYLDQEANAKSEIEWVLEYGTKANIQMAHYILGQMDWKKGNNQKAFEQLIIAFDKAKELNDVISLIKIMCILANIAFYFEWGKLSNYKDFEELLNEIDYLVYEEFPLWHGILLVNIGHLAIKEGQFYKAVELYKKGLAKQAEYKFDVVWIENFTLYRQLSFINDKIIKLLNPEKIIELGAELNNHWETNHYDLSHPEAINFFGRWKKL